MRLLYIVVLALWPALASAADLPGEAQVKAAYVLNFAKFTEWPAQAFRDQQAPLVICVLGNQDTLSAFAGIEGKNVHGRETRVQANPRGAELRACHVLYVSQTEVAQPAALLKANAARPILTVSDIAGFAEAGGMLGLVPVDGRIRFEANISAAKVAGLRLGSQLLNLARVVD